MREILFKAKRVDNGEWVEGYYAMLKYPLGVEHRIYNGYYEQDNPDYPEYDIVELETVCQFTGLLDKNGKKIFEGDAITDDTGIGVIVWDNLACSFKVSYTKENKGYGKWFDDYLACEFKNIEVIGNIHDKEDI